METTRNLDFEKVPQVCVELEIAINLFLGLILGKSNFQYPPDLCHYNYY